MIQIAWDTQSGEGKNITAEQLSLGGANIMGMHFRFSGEDWSELPEDTVFKSNCASLLRDGWVSAYITNDDAPFFDRSHIIHSSNLVLAS